MPDPLIDIRPDHWAIVADILRRHVPDREVWAFGSRAKWNAKEYSDLDLAVIGQTPLSLSVSAALADDFSESDLPFKVDVVDWATTGESFRKIIERDKVVVQEGKRTGAGMGGEWQTIPFEHLLTEPVRNGIYKPKAFHGRGAKIVNMGELFAHPRLRAVPMKRVDLSDSEGKRFVLSKGDLLFARRSLVAEGAGKCSIVLEIDEPTTFESSIIRARPDGTKAEPLYLYYFFNSTHGLHCLDTIRRQVAVAGITGSDLSRLEILIPPLPEQRAIAHILGTLDDKIELNQRMSETLEAMARALFKSWFVDFDPVRAKQPNNVGWVSPSGRNPPDKTDGGLHGYAANPPYELPPHIADLFPARLANSAVGDIPEGWEVGTLADFSSLNPETWSKDTRPEIINYVDLSNTKWGRIEAVTAHSQQDAPSRAQRVLRLRDTIVGTVRPGNGSYAFISEDRLTGSTGFAVLRPLKVEYAEFVYFAATAPENIEALSHLADGGAYPAVRPEVVAAMQVIRSVDDVMERFSRVAWPLLAKMAENERESRTLAALRDTLLPKLISGELRVKDAERVAVGET